MPRLGLALSGGGFRATLFHLGVVRCLRDAGLLPQIAHIASVSGGSIIAAHLALNWERYCGSEESFDDAAEELIHFVQLDVRNRIARRYALLFPLRLLMRLGFRRPGRRFTLNGLLEDHYADFLYGDKCVHELPESPALHILATNVSEGFLSSFQRSGLLMQRRSETEIQVDALPGRLARVSMAVAASSAFPGFFPPVEIGAAEIGLKVGEFASHTFTDGGVYDNLGVRAFTWLIEREEKLDEILVSDAGQLFRILRNTSVGFFANAMRASDVLWDRVGQLERQNFGADPRFLFIPIVEQVDESQDTTAVHPILQPEIQNIRTDLDRFTPLEISALVTHGYAVTRQRLRGDPGFADLTIPEGPAWDPLAKPEEDGPRVPLSPLNAAEGVSERTRELQKSAGRRIWGSLLDFRDPVSFFYVPILVLLFLVLPWQGYRLYDRARTNGLVIQAIANGDPEFRAILDLFERDPSDDWEPTEVVSQAEALPVSYAGIEVLTDTRILDLRKWSADDPEVFSIRRIRVRKEAGYQGDGKIRFDHYVPLVDEFTVRLQPESLDPVVRITEEAVDIPSDTLGEEGTRWQTEFDLSEIAEEQVVDLTITGFFTLRDYQEGSRVSFQPPYDIGVASTWLLFPEDKPYRKYTLLQYEPGEAGEPRLVEPRFVIDHPLVSIIAWSITNAQAGNVYECRWEWEY